MCTFGAKTQDCKKAKQKQIESETIFLLLSDNVTSNAHAAVCNGFVFAVMQPDFNEL